MKSHETILVNIQGVELVVDYKYYYDPGVYTYSNGDPGYPPYEELEILHVNHREVDIYNLLSQEIIEEIEEKCIKSLS